MSFSELMKYLDKPKLLLWNGFSMAYDDSRFSFTSLLDSAVDEWIIEKDSKVYKVFESLKTADFESVMRALEDTKKIVEVYEWNVELQELLKNDAEELKKYLVAIITNNHPKISTEVSEDEKKSCAKFLSNFESIYTLNYDLLLYWAVMQDETATKQFWDWFWEDEYSLDEDYVVYKNSKSFKLHYLHWALHLFDAWSEIIKKTYSKTEIDLITQIKKNLDEWVYPIFISEWDAKQKMTKILHSAYLNHCYKSFKSIWWKSALVIYGTNLKKNDEHILNAIMESNVTNIYIWVSDPKNVEHVSNRITLFNESQKDMKKHKHLQYFNSRSVNPWKYE